MICTLLLPDLGNRMDGYWALPEIPIRLIPSNSLTPVFSCLCMARRLVHLLICVVLFCLVYWHLYGRKGQRIHVEDLLVLGRVLD